MLMHNGLKPIYALAKDVIKIKQTRKCYILINEFSKLCIPILLP
jgi:hypothetical protein